MSIHGTLHQGALVFTNSGRQCISNSVAALVYHLNNSISTWETHDLDHILDQGDNLHSILFGHLNEDYPLGNSLPKQLIVCDYQVDSFTGLLEAMNDDPPYFSIETAVLNVNNFAILTLGSCTPAFSSAIVKEDDIYYIFDPHNRDSAGMASPDGTTVRISHVSVAKLHANENASWYLVGAVARLVGQWATKTEVRGLNPSPGQVNFSLLPVSTQH
ncbi:hypothetical protein PoB_000545100 [Plakobranchus ocellatus]|uniref:Peptidase C76 domain-containing protein n=1 Tax=Plakobranchus ocellatus TaxID=259542 RepID=A0AAV3Y6U6_9GAST|nr:hypothetical protein PoB_000545100 [Plakobranchus ocellatus]